MKDGRLETEVEAKKPDEQLRKRGEDPSRRGAALLRAEKARTTEPPPVVKAPMKVKTGGSAVRKALAPAPADLRFCGLEEHVHQMSLPLPHLLDMLVRMKGQLLG